METLIQAAGWAGTALIVSAYLLVSLQAVGPKSAAYQVMNLFGAIGVGVNVFHQKAWPAVALQATWAAIAIASLLRPAKPVPRSGAKDAE